MRKHLFAAAALTASLAAAVACGTNGTTTPTTDAATSLTATQVASRIGAVNIKPYDPPTLYAATEVTATWHGRTVDIAAFATDQNKESWISAARVFGPIMTTGPLYAIVDDGPAS